MQRGGIHRGEYVDKVNMVDSAALLPPYRSRILPDRLELEDAEGWDRHVDRVGSAAELVVLGPDASLVAGV